MSLPFVELIVLSLRILHAYPYLYAHPYPNLPPFLRITHYQTPEYSLCDANTTSSTQSPHD